MKKITVSCTTRAFVSTNRYLSPSEQLRRIIAGEEKVHDFCFTDHNMTDCGYIEVGTASITVELCTTPADLTAAEVAILQREIDELDRKHHAAREALLGRISKLQALPFEGVEA